MNQQTITAAVGVALALFLSAEPTPTVDLDSAGFGIVEVSCIQDEDGPMRCAAEIDRVDGAVGMLMVAWGIDGGYLATDAFAGSNTSWTFDDPPQGDHIVSVAVIDPGTGHAVEATVNVELGSGESSWHLWLLLVTGIVVLGVFGALLGRRRHTRSARSHRCPVCSTTFGEGDGFCPACGSAVAPGAAKFCSGCGQPVSRQDRFCPLCGTDAREV